jgi:hypothetical protein
MLILFTLIGCFKITYTSGPAPITTPEQHREWHHRFYSGAVEARGPFDASSVCPDGVAQIRTEVSVANSLATMAVDTVTSSSTVNNSGFYTPSTIKVWCR